MGKKVADVVAYIESIAPLTLQEDWDHSGLMLGSLKMEVGRVLCTLDVNPSLVEEAIEKDIDLIVSHHPFFFKPINRIDLDSQKGRMIADLLAHDISLYSAHTNYDQARGGVNDVLKDLLNLENAERIEVKKESLARLDLFFEKDGDRSLVDKVKDRLGSDLLYLESWPLEVFSQIEKKEKAVQKFSLYFPSRRTSDFPELSGFVSKVGKADCPLSLRKKEERPGMGLVGDLASPMTLETLARELKQLLDLSSIKLTGHHNHIVSRLALCGGAGKSLMGAAKAKGADVLVTGDIDYHTALDALEMDLMLIDASHYGTEKPAMVALAEKIARDLSLSCEFSASSKDIMQVL